MALYNYHLEMNIDPISRVRCDRGRPADSEDALPARAVEDEVVVTPAGLADPNGLLGPKTAPVPVGLETVGVGRSPLGGLGMEMVGVGRNPVGGLGMEMVGV